MLFFERMPQGGGRTIEQDPDLLGVIQEYIQQKDSLTSKEFKALGDAAVWVSEHIAPFAGVSWNFIGELERTKTISEGERSDIISDLAALIEPCLHQEYWSEKKRDTVVGVIEAARDMLTEPAISAASIRQTLVAGRRLNA